jgi:hypothetical protein
LQILIHICSANYGRHLTRAQVDELINNAHGSAETKAFFASRSEVALISETRNGEYLTFEGMTFAYHRSFALRLPRNYLQSLGNITAKALRNCWTMLRYPCAIIAQSLRTHCVIAAK